MYKVIGTGRNRAFRVIWMLEELGVDYEIVPAKPRSVEARAYNPSGKIPSLLVDDVLITDSVAIITYLGDKYQRFTARPGTIERALQDAMTCRLLDELEAQLWSAAKHEFAYPPERRVSEVTPSLRWEFAHNLNQIADAITGPYLFGAGFVVSDILFTQLLMWAGSRGFLDEDARIAAYMTYIKERPGYQRAEAALN